MRNKINKFVSTLIIGLMLVSFLPNIRANAVTNINPTGAAAGNGKILVGYWHNFDNGSGIVKVRDVAPEWDVIQIAFGITDEKDLATIIFDPVYDKAEFKQDIKTVQAKGKKVLLSIGGETGKVKLLTQADEDNFVKSLTAIIDEYGFDGVDIDLEGGSGISVGAGDKDFKNPTSPLLVHLINGYKRVCAKYGEDFILTMAPETLYVQGGFSAYGGTCGGYLPIIYGLMDELTYLHVQHYNTGGMLGLDGQNYTQGTADFHVAMAEMMLEGFPIAGNSSNMFPPIPAEKLLIGLPSSPRAAGGGYTKPEDVTKAVKYLVTGESYGGRYKLRKTGGYPDLKGLMTWSINWDIVNNYEFSKTYRKLLDSFVIVPNTLKPATLSASAVTNGKFSLSINVPERNSAVKYRLYEGVQEIATGSLSSGQINSQTVRQDIRGKAEGRYSYKVVLEDSKGNTVNSNVVQVDVPKQEVVDKTLPDRIMVGYWHNFDNGSVVIKLRDVDPAWDVINVSFGETYSDRAVVEFHPIYNEGEFIDDIAYLQSKGKKVVLSLGGAEGTIQIPTDEARQKFMTSITGLIDKFGFDGIDIDLEGGSGMILAAGDNDLKNPTTPQIVNFIKSIKELDAKYGKDFIVSMAPELSYVQGGNTGYAGNWGAYLPLIDAVRDELDFLQVQHYNCGGNMALDGKTYNQGTADFQVAMVEMLLQGFQTRAAKNSFFEPLRQDQVVIGVPASQKGTFLPNSGYIPPAEMIKALDYLIKGKSYGGEYKMIGEKYPNLRGIMTWSINWDIVNNKEFIRAYRPYFDALPPVTPVEPPVEKDKEDVNKDGKVDALDLSLVANKYNTKTGESNFDSKCDINSDGIVDIFDLTRVSKKLGSDIIDPPGPDPDKPAQWKSGTAYKLGDLVTYQNKVYKCIYAHTSHEGWLPGSVPTLWEEVK